MNVFRCSRRILSCWFRERMVRGGLKSRHKLTASWLPVTRSDRHNRFATQPTLRRLKGGTRAPEKAEGWSGESPLLCGEEPCGIEP
jgi:hypothetical protein